MLYSYGPSTKRWSVEYGKHKIGEAKKFIIIIIIIIIITIKIDSAYVSSAPGNLVACFSPEVSARGAENVLKAQLKLSAIFFCTRLKSNFNSCAPFKFLLRKMTFLSFTTRACGMRGI